MAKKDLLTVMTRIVYHDGDKIVQVQEIPVRSGTAWKQLQATVAKRFCVPFHQIGLYIVSGDPNVAAADPVAHKLSPDALFLDPTSYLLAIVHQSPTRISRRRRIYSQDKPTPERILLRRDPTGGGCYSPSSAQVEAMRLAEDELMAQLYLAQGGASWHPDEVAMVQQAYQARSASIYASEDANSAAQFLKYRSSMANSQQSVSSLRSLPYDSGRAIPNNENFSACEVCKQGSMPEFHLCKSDRVLGPTIWRGEFGPIGKPGCGYLL